MRRGYAVLNINEEEVSKRTGLKFVEAKEPNPSGPRLTAEFHIADDPSPYMLVVYKGNLAGSFRNAVWIESNFEHHSEQFAVNAQKLLDALKMENSEIDWTCRMGPQFPRMM